MPSERVLSASPRGVEMSCAFCAAARWSASDGERASLRCIASPDGTDRHTHSTGGRDLREFAALHTRRTMVYKSITWLTLAFCRVTLWDAWNLGFVRPG
eukprot:3430827-Prymnesium_polylepis.1